MPAYRHKRYKTHKEVEVEGIEFKTDDLKNVTSFPDHHYKNGDAKNNATNGVFKSVVRILKNTRTELEEKGLIPENSMSSFFIESLVWNVPINYFRGHSYRECARSVALKIWSDMQDSEKSSGYAEVCDLHWLFRGQSRYSPAQAESFMLKAWSYLE